MNLSRSSWTVGFGEVCRDLDVFTIFLSLWKLSSASSLSDDCGWQYVPKLMVCDNKATNSALLAGVQYPYRLMAIDLLHLSLTCDLQLQSVSNGLLHAVHRPLNFSMITIILLFTSILLVCWNVRGLSVDMFMWKKGVTYWPCESHAKSVIAIG